MKNKEFLNKKANDMTVSELAEAIKLKVLRTEKPLEKGDRVRIIQYFSKGMYSELDGKEGTLLEIREDVYPYIVRLDDGDRKSAHKVEKIESKKKEEKFEPGAVYIHNSDHYILARTDFDEYVMIGLTFDKGNRWIEPIKTDSISALNGTNGNFKYVGKFNEVFKIVGDKKC